jgi:hypothetical protein
MFSEETSSTPQFTRYSSNLPLAANPISLTTAHVELNRDTHKQPIRHWRAIRVLLDRIAYLIRGVFRGN